jgi:tetratricopeptide (TPR) repeat protein
MVLGTPLPPPPGIVLAGPPLPDKLFHLEKQQYQVRELMKLYHLCCKHGLYEEAQKIALKTCEVDPANAAALAAVRVANLLKEKVTSHAAVRPCAGKCPAHAQPATPVSRPKPKCGKPGKVSKLMQQFDTYYKEGKYAEAEQCALRAHEMDPDNAAVTAACKLALGQALSQCPPAGCAMAAGKCGAPCGAPGDCEVGRRLCLPVSVKFHDAPLGEVMNGLHELTGINIMVDCGSLMDAHLDPAQRMTFQADGVSLKSVLELMLPPAHLAYAIKDGVLVITSDSCYPTHCGRD